MTRIEGASKGICLGLVMLVNLSLPEAWARQAEELNIGIPDFPRRVSRGFLDLPAEREGIKAGILRIHPSVSSVVEYDDNVTLRAHDAEEDVIFTETPGVDAKMGLGDHTFRAGYGMEIVNFVQNTEENAINHLAGAAADFVFKDFTLSVEDAFENTTNRVFSETSARDHLWLNAVTALARYDRPKWAAEVGWTHNTIEHKTGEFEPNNYNEDVLAVLAGYKIMPKTLLLAEWDNGWVYYDVNTTNADAYYFQVLGGVRGEVTADIDLTFKFGFQDRQLDKVDTGGQQDDFDGVVGVADLAYRITADDTFRTGYVRTVKTSTFAGNSWYRQDKVSISYRKRMLRKWVVTPVASWQFNDYPEQAVIGGIQRRRDDHFYTAGVEVRYEFRDWVSVGAAYKFRARQSNFETFDYENNRFLFDVRLVY